MRGPFSYTSRSYCYTFRMKERMSERILRTKGVDRAIERLERTEFPVKEVENLLKEVGRANIEQYRRTGELPPGALGEWVSAYRLYKKACMADLERFATLHHYDQTDYDRARDMAHAHFDYVQSEFFDELDEEVALRTQIERPIRERRRVERTEEEPVDPVVQKRGAFARSILALLAFGTVTAATVEVIDEEAPSTPVASQPVGDGLYIDSPVVEDGNTRTIQDLIDHPPVAGGEFQYQPGPLRPHQDVVAERAPVRRVEETINTPEGGALPGDSTEPNALDESHPTP